MFVDLDLPAGFRRSGTDLQSRGRWRDGSLVRWRDGAMMPVGGWRERADFTSGIYRGSMAWEDNSGDRWLAVGSHSALKVSTLAGSVSDITPVGFTSGNESASLNTGYGSGAYGTGAHGTPRQATTFSEATTWSMSPWGEYLIACSNADGKIYEWQLNTGTPAAAVTNAPTDCLGVVVTPERFVFALGAGGEPRKVQWSDREDNTTWTPAATNEAGDQTLDGVGQIMCGFNVPGETLIVTDAEAYAATYQGPPFVYGFRRIGSACGIVSRKAIAATDSGAIWMGRKGFFRYQGGTVEEIECEVADFIFGDISEDQASKAHAVTNGQFGEVWFFFPCGSSTEVDKYVSYNYRSGFWAIGELARTTGVDRGAFPQPVWVGSDSVANDHEVGLSYGGADIYAESGPLMLGSNASLVTAQELHPDETTQGDVTFTFKVRNYPNAAETSHGPYTAATPTNVRFTGRQIRMRADGATLADWRVGAPRLRVAERGRR